MPRKRHKPEEIVAKLRRAMRRASAAVIGCCASINPRGKARSLMNYVDGFVTAVSAANREIYKEHAKPQQSFVASHAHAVWLAYRPRVAFAARTPFR